MFKFDIQETYHLMWMCKEWQAKQVVMVGDMWHVDFCNCFRNWGSYKVFLSFASLVVWIAEHVKRILNLQNYIDDNASFGPAGHMLYYEPYQLNADGTVSLSITLPVLSYKYLRVIFDPKLCWMLQHAKTLTTALFWSFKLWHISKSIYNRNKATVQYGSSTEIYLQCRSMVYLPAQT